MVVSRLRRDGFHVVRGLLSRADVAMLAAAFDRLLTVARSLPGTTDWGGSRFVLDVEPFRLHRVVWCGAAEPCVGAYGSDPRVLVHAAEALQSAELVQLVMQAHFKLPGDGVSFDLHQDASNRRYGTDLWTDLDGRGSFVQIAVAVDPMGPDNGGLRFARGSQNAGFVADPVTGALPPDAADPASIRCPRLSPGDAVLFGPFVVHGSEPNRSAAPRRTLLLGYALPGANRRVYPGCGLGVTRWAKWPTRRVQKAPRPLRGSSTST